MIVDWRCRISLWRLANDSLEIVSLGLKRGFTSSCNKNSSLDIKIVSKRPQNDVRGRSCSDYSTSEWQIFVAWEGQDQVPFNVNFLVNALLFDLAIIIPSHPLVTRMRSWRIGYLKEGQSGSVKKKTTRGEGRRAGGKLQGDDSASFPALSFCSSHFHSGLSLKYPIGMVHWTMWHMTAQSPWKTCSFRLFTFFFRCRTLQSKQMDVCIAALNGGHHSKVLGIGLFFCKLNQKKPKKRYTFVQTERPTKNYFSSQLETDCSWSTKSISHPP